MKMQCLFSSQIILYYMHTLDTYLKVSIINFYVVHEEKRVIFQVGNNFTNCMEMNGMNVLGLLYLRNTLW